MQFLYFSSLLVGFPVYAIPLSEALSLLCGVSQLLLFPLLFLLFSFHPGAVHLSVLFNLICFISIIGARLW